MGEQTRKRKMENSVVCFIDILGFSNMISESCENGNGNDLLNKIRDIINKNINYIKPTNKRFGTIKIFTDNIVIGRPIRDDGEIELGHIFVDFAYYQTLLTLEGFFIRGGVSVGDYYADKIMSFGPPLLEAHNIENSISKTPRIVLSKEARNMVIEHLKYYSEPEINAPQTREILEDADGEWFVNYLAVLFEEIAEDGFASAYNILLKHKSIVESKMKEYSIKYEILAKYLWVAQYHNYFCKTTCPQNKDLLIDHLIGAGKFKSIGISK